MSEFDEDRQEGGGESQTPLDTPAAAPAPAMREDQLQNAVAFLSHPKVRSSTAASKREFLQRKGLTEAEIDEAFCRVPEQPAAAAPPASPGASTPSAVHSTLQHLQPQPQQGAHQIAYMQPQQQQQQQQPGYSQGAMVVAAPQPMQQQQPGVRWTQAVLGAGFLAASAYAAKQLLWPYMEGAYYTWRGHVRPPPRPLLANGDTAHSSQATQAMADAITAQTTELRSSIDSIKQLVAALEAQNQRAAAAEAGGGGSAGGAAASAGDGLTVADLRQELRSFAETLQELASPGRVAATPGPAQSSKLESELGEIKTLLAELLRSPRSSGSHSPQLALALPGSKAAAAEASTPQSAASVLPMRHSPEPDAGRPAAAIAAAGAQDGIQPTGSSSLGMPPPQAQLQPGAKQAASSQQGQEQQAQQTPALSLHAAASSAAPLMADGPPAPPPHPASYMEVLEMLEKGQTPPGIRTDINDKPPNPLATPAAAKMKPRPKPWERSGAGSSLAGSLTAGAGGSSSSLGSLGAGGLASLAPAAAAPQPVNGPVLPSMPQETAGGGALTPAAGSAAQAGQQGLSPVRAPSPAEGNAADSAAASAGRAGGEEVTPIPQEQQQGVKEQLVAAPGSFHSPPKRAASIYEAVAPAPDSPHIIAGRLSPGRPDAPLGRSGSSSSLGGGGGGPPGSSQGGTFAALLAAAQERADGAAALSASGESLPAPAPLEGSGIGRPISRNWRPPPIPAPTLSGSSSGLAAGTSGAAAGSAGPGSNAGGGLAAGVRAASAASLGEDFSSA